MNLTTSVSIQTESHLSIGGEKHVPCLEISVDDEPFVQELQRLAHLVADKLDLRLSQRLLQVHHDAVQRPAPAELYVHLRT